MVNLLLRYKQAALAIALYYYIEMTLSIRIIKLPTVVVNLFPLRH